MGVPSQGAGPSTPWSPDGSYPTFPVDLPNEGTPWNFTRLITLIALAFNGIGWLKDAQTTSLAGLLTAFAKQTAASGDTLIGVLTYAGRFLALPTGTLRTALQYIADHAITDAPSLPIAPSASTFTADYSTARNFHVFTPVQSSLEITLKSTSPAPPDGAEMTIAAYSVASGNTVTIVRENASQIVIMTGAASGANFGFGRFKFITGVWRLMDATGLAAQWGATVPGSINNP